jgi:hypothetical protein
VSFVSQLPLPATESIGVIVSHLSSASKEKSVAVEACYRHSTKLDSHTKQKSKPIISSVCVYQYILQMASQTASISTIRKRNKNARKHGRNEKKKEKEKRK